jgi:aminoglycoside phosphotransferase (APT) family kinase protein
LAVRLPRRGVAATLIIHEQAWLPRLAAHLTMTVPAPVRLGTPGKGYPWHWSVVPWLKGITTDQHALETSQASRLGAFCARSIFRLLRMPQPILCAECSSVTALLRSKHGCGASPPKRV